MLYVLLGRGRYGVGQAVVEYGVILLCCVGVASLGLTLLGRQLGSPGGLLGSSSEAVLRALSLGGTAGQAHAAEQPSIPPSAQGNGSSPEQNPVAVPEPEPPVRPVLVDVAAGRGQEGSTPGGSSLLNSEDGQRLAQKYPRLVETLRHLSDSARTLAESQYWALDGAGGRTTVYDSPQANPTRDALNMFRSDWQATRSQLKSLKLSPADRRIVTGIVKEIIRDGRVFSMTVENTPPDAPLSIEIQFIPGQTMNNADGLQPYPLTVARPL
jgi:hypothetical protein